MIVIFWNSYITFWFALTFQLIKKHSELYNKILIFLSK
ncbi:hypothetical protein LEP1GSC072_1536 [Leptospira noguchii str. Bonito]|nr:hypothetical protein LEP1GSC072_1536 [Leptospira noguchii str. Bonito]